MVRIDIYCRERWLRLRAVCPRHGRCRAGTARALSHLRTTFDPSYMKGAAMRFLESLLIVFALIFVLQLVITALILAALILFLFCLWRRPKESLFLGLGLLLVLLLSTPAGLALVATIAVGFC